MSYVEIPSDYRFPWYVRLFLANQRWRYGSELEPARLWGRSHKVFAGLSLLYGALDRKSIIIEPAFCVDINSATGIKRGLTEAHLAALPEFEVSPLFDERIKAALVYAAAITKNGVNANLMARLKNYFNDDAIINPSALIAYKKLSSKFYSALEVAAQVFCFIPPSSKIWTEKQG